MANLGQGRAIVLGCVGGARLHVAPERHVPLLERLGRRVPLRVALARRAPQQILDLYTRAAAVRDYARHTAQAQTPPLPVPPPP